jgi:hypothetical protein
LKETRTIRLEETAAHKRATLPGADPSTTIEAGPDEATSNESPDAEEDAGQGSQDATESEAKSGGWSLFKRGKGGAAKQKPGKLPPRPEQLSKDSREAAADILREMQRRR